MQSKENNKSIGSPPPFEVPLVDVSHINKKWLDIPYADLSTRQKLDIYLPDKGDGPFPVILYIHGGGFEIGNKRDDHFSPILKGLEHDYAVIAVGYRLSGEAIFPAGLQDVKAAIRWIRANQQHYHLDGDRIAAWGGSSGGNYAAMIGLTDQVPELEDLSLGNPEYSCNVQAIVDWFGPIDFLRMDEQFEESGFGLEDRTDERGIVHPLHTDEDSPESKYLGAKITEVPDKAVRANPMTYIHENMPPILIQHGSLDINVPVQQSIIFVEKLKKLASPDGFEFDILEGAGHGDPQFETDENMKRVFAFLDKVLK